MSGTVWSKFFWSDWQTDPSLRACSYAARGLWMDMLCIAASHDPIGYVAVAGRALDSTAIARMTGGAESEVVPLLAELDQNGVFSRDRHGRIYSRRMTKDAKKAAEARKNGARGGNPNLGKGKGNRPWDNPPVKGEDKGRDKPHMPEARRKVEPKKGSNLPSAQSPTSEPEGSSSPGRWSGPQDIRELCVSKHGEDFTRSWLDVCSWQDVPEPMILAPGQLYADRLWRALRRELTDRGVSIGRKAA